MATKKTAQPENPLKTKQAQAKFKSELNELMQRYGIKGSIAGFRLAASSRRVTTSLSDSPCNCPNCCPGKAPNYYWEGGVLKCVCN